jgi:hypothetical protein
MTHIEVIHHGKWTEKGQIVVKCFCLICFVFLAVLSVSHLSPSKPPLTMLETVTPFKRAEQQQASKK